MAFEKLLFRFIVPNQSEHIEVVPSPKLSELKIKGSNTPLVFVKFNCGTNKPADPTQ